MLIAGFATGALQANCYVLALDEGAECVIVDPGEGALAYVKELVSDCSLRPVAAVLTHGHLDHAASLGAVCAEWAIPGYIHAADEYMLDDPMASLSPELRAMMAGQLMPNMRPADLRHLHPGADLCVAGLTLHVDHTPGHTGGGVVFRFDADVEAERPEVLLTGDTLFQGSIGRTDLPGGSMDELLLSLKTKLLTRPDDAMVLPGHGPSSTIGAERAENPFLANLA
ncbi:MBL fold metallo-hydrolase [Nakamurella antarctica]|uniref:MBL fold metallo-hydrolase n=1 Tax=Nakamurella antarctica TaxID=1902245 RepID=A0A3G8ZLN3_9ACTN|nr:MBL fold metallo-hydrolase [Nakamurella antarctica]AZI57735.1 MBL fold metallo-hydrolase [Nakamurella antarctica]